MTSSIIGLRIPSYGQYMREAITNGTLVVYLLHVPHVHWIVCGTTLFYLILLTSCV